ncbi:MAG TPA: copper resistance protein NlpE N-terminal domain-containing protein [Chitinophagaceae bacterium]
MKNRCLTCLLVLFIWACNANTATDTATSVRDSVGTIPDTINRDNGNFSSSPGDTTLFGFYQGVLPCRDCQGIRHTLLLKDSGQFKLEEFILGRNTFPGKFTGRWTKQGDSLHLISNNENIATYYIQGDTLRVKFRKGELIADSVAKNYWIARQPDASMNKVWRQKMREGIDLYAIGNEPFWNLEIDNEKSIAFRIAELKKPITFTITQPHINKDSTHYMAGSGTDKLEVTVYNEFCNDGMSDNYYEYRVHVRYKGETYKGCGVNFRK